MSGDAATSMAGLNDADWRFVAEHVERFETAWKENPNPEVGPFLPGASSSRIDGIDQGRPGIPLAQ